MFFISKGGYFSVDKILWHLHWQQSKAVGEFASISKGMSSTGIGSVFSSGNISINLSNKSIHQYGKQRKEIKKQATINKARLKINLE